METFRNCLNDPAADTLLLPLLARARCGERYPGLFRDPEAERIAALMPAEKTESLRRLADADCVLTRCGRTCWYGRHGGICGSIRRRWW